MNERTSNGNTTQNISKHKFNSIKLFNAGSEFLHAIFIRGRRCRERMKHIFLHTRQGHR